MAHEMAEAPLFLGTEGPKFQLARDRSDALQAYPKAGHVKRMFPSTARKDNDRNVPSAQ